MRFEWDLDKAAVNLAKHGVSFEQASELFTSGVDFLEIFDETRSLVEERFWAIGRIRRGLVVVVYAEIDEDTVRIISVRMATARERALYGARMEDR